MTYENPKQIILSNDKFCCWYCSCVLTKTQMVDFTYIHFGTSGPIAQFLKDQAQVTLYRLGSCHKLQWCAKLCIDQCFLQSEWWNYQYCCGSITAIDKCQI
jgi:hypothetical protein